MSLTFRSVLFHALLMSALMASSCEQQKPAATAAPAAPAKSAATPAVEARYECPMGCAGSQSTKPGKCPTCEMELVKKS
ncbi:heavy metal-binding domain-containing protein [Hymenobacter sp. BT770]|uniref:heavy metal-binding domain-containing protein n=1 Tax=Hymenobacter sp. BT770 TaxID=2886942 RepID=UPI001D117F3C|nr:heavy metal-binding domain-containing protein [Hymenobacter sp. BT770]MCC3152080.1 hypothetical protein [Hymenobacter sp. BT770]MDO3415237.1 heavy metal-binding domain-containing protein [Hymenobacter sp. BT770]